MLFGVSVDDETVFSTAAVDIGRTSVGAVSSHVSVVTGAEVADASVVVAGTEVDVVVAGTEVDGVVSATTTVVPRTSEVSGSAEGELPPQPAATLIAIRYVATRRFTARVSQIITVGMSYRMARKRSRVQFPLAPRDTAGQRPAVFPFSVQTLSGSDAGSNARAPTPSLRFGLTGATTHVLQWRRRGSGRDRRGVGS